MKKTEFEQAIGKQRVISSLDGGFIRIMKTGNLFFANLFVSKGKVYAASDKVPESIGIAQITNVGTKRKKLIKKIKINLKNSHSVVAEII